MLLFVALNAINPLHNKVKQIKRCACATFNIYYYGIDLEMWVTVCVCMCKIVICPLMAVSHLDSKSTIDICTYISSYLKLHWSVAFYFFRFFFNFMTTLLFSRSFFFIFYCINCKSFLFFSGHCCCWSFRLFVIKLDNTNAFLMSFSTLTQCDLLCFCDKNVKLI